MATQHKAEALAALTCIRSQVIEPGLRLDGLIHRMLVAAVDEAIAQVEAIEELKRARKRPRAK